MVRFGMARVRLLCGSVNTTTSCVPDVGSGNGPPISVVILSNRSLGRNNCI